jgi:xylulokinase
MTLVLGFDVGTQSTKGLAIDAETQTVVARASRSYDLIAGLPEGAAEQHPHTWTDALRVVAGELCADLDSARIAAIGVSGQQHGLVVLDESGEVVRPAKLWCDTSTALEARDLSQRLGRAVPTGFTASKVAWLARHEPQAWARVRQVLLPHDYINLRLTGNACMEAGDASGTGFFDPVAREFDAAAVEATDARLADCLPALIESHAPAGHVTPRAAREFGLPEGALVSAGGGDNMLSAIGSGATRAGRVTLSLGTSGTVFSHSDSAVQDPEGLIAPFCSSTGAWLPLLCVMNLTGVTEEVRRGFGMGHDPLTNAARDVPIGCDGLLWLPYLMGERVPDLPNARGTLLGMRPGHLRPGTLYRAALEGTSLNLAWGVDRLRALGIAPLEVRLVGGAARNALWREILADTLNAPIVPLIEAESAALGAALQALWCLRRQSGEDVDISTVADPYIAAATEPTRPDAQRVAAYAQLGERFRAAVN